MYQNNPSLPPQETMPTMYDLPSELVAESGLPDEFHCTQADLLSETCQPVNYSSEEMLLASDLNLYWLEEIEMGLGLWQGSYQNTEGLWLRWYNANGWLPTLAERAENERERADKLAGYLRFLRSASLSLGVDPDSVN